MKSGFVALIGEPNVGKSTLLNRLIGQKVSITSRRPQTTRHRILGIKSIPQAQMIFIDTPGMHGNSTKSLNRYMNRTADGSLLEVDVALWIKDTVTWCDYDKVIISKLNKSRTPTILTINKIDRIKSKTRLLPFLDDARKRFAFEELIPVSALKGINLKGLEKAVVGLLPERDAVYPENVVTDRTQRFLAAETIREKLVRRLNQELPHALSVEIEQFIEKASTVRINAVIWVERDGQKVIVIGKKGENLKAVGQQAREDIEDLLGMKVCLDLWVKVKKGWSDNERFLQSLGYYE